MPNITQQQAREELARRRVLREMQGQSTPGQQQQGMQPSLGDEYGRTLQSATQQTPSLEQPHYGNAQAAALGAAQGASLGFADELEGAAKALGIEPGRLVLSLLGGPLGPALYASAESAKKILTDPGSIPADYVSGRDNARARYERAELDRPAAFLAGELVGGAAPFLIPGGAAGRGALGLVKSGALVGAAAGMGGSRSDITGGDMDQVAAAGLDTISGGVAGGAIGAVAGAGAGLVRRAVSPATAARRAAIEAAEQVRPRMAEAEAINFAKSQNQMLAESAELEREAAAMGQPLRFSPEQSTGDPALALAKQRAWNDPKSMRDVQGAERHRQSSAVKLQEMWVNKLAGNPELLGKTDVANAFSAIINEAADDIQRSASAAFGEALEKANGITKGSRVVPTAPLAEALANLELEYRTAGKSVRSALAASLADLHSVSGPTGKVTLSDANGMLKYWGAVAAGKKRIDSTLSPEEQRLIGSKIKEAVSSGLDLLPEGSIPGKAKEILLSARSAYAQAKAERDAILTEPIKKLLAKNAVAGEKAVSAMLRMEPSELKGVMAVAGKVNQEMAKDLRAQLFESVLEEGGKASREATLSAKSGVSRLRYGPGRVFGALRDYEATLKAAGGGDKEFEQTFVKSLGLWQRLSFSADIKGSSTYSMFAQLADEAGQGVANRVERAASSVVPGGDVLMRAARAVASASADGRYLAKLYTTPGAADLFNDALESVLAGRVKRGLTMEAVEALANIGGIKAEETRSAAIGSLE